MSRFEDAQRVHARGMGKVATTPEPKGQKFPNGSRVRIADDLGDGMSHFTSGVNATVVHTYAHAYGGRDVKSYCLNVDGEGRRVMVLRTPTHSDQRGLNANRKELCEGPDGVSGRCPGCRSCQ